MRGRGVAAGGLVALALAGCNGGTTSPGENAAGTVRSFILDCAAGKETDALELLSPPSRRRFLDHGPDILTRCQSVIPFGLPEGTDPKVLRAAQADPSPGPFRSDHQQVDVRFRGRLIPVLVEQLYRWHVVGNYAGLGAG